jgi:hypothetical protein
MTDRNFEFFIPASAKIDGAQAQTAGGQWVNANPTALPEKGRYAFDFPLRPGQTDFQVTYRLPYRGTATIDPKPLYPLEHLVVIMPQSMQFVAAQKGIYDNKQPPNQPGAIAEVAANTRTGQQLSFTISGTGILKEDDSQAESGEGGSASQSSDGETAVPPGARDSRPGGGLGPPSEAPDPLKHYRWPILGGFAVLLVAGAIYIAVRSKNPAAPYVASAIEIPNPRNTAVPGRSGLLLEALKEELFQLEVEHKQGAISQQEYEKAKAALDQTLERAVKRVTVKAT